MIAAARRIHHHGAPAVVVKGGHLREPDVVDVLFDGTRNRPWGMFLTTETERQYSDRQRPLREARDLSAAEIRDLLADVQVEPAPAVAMRFHVHPDTVDFIVNAVGMGFLKVSA